MFSLEIFLDLFSLVLNRAAQISQHFFVETDHSVTVHLVFCISSIFWAHLEGSLSLLREVALAESLLRIADVIRGARVPDIRVEL